ncbi:baseplate J/gp47 family protein [Listeria seeligeri]|uniref:baseplate J/gp47 family protein n=1 Tax=Listeria seeligeri TaxID=1640 RepID=UPI001942258A|nr:baseplate J/gp47 family protein [Listeria seeligeri]MBM5675618.1 baseplate J/gp47 family protein [Listeria seeligeri]
MLDENGFKRKTYDELLTDMEIKAKELFGEDINLNSHSALGVFLRIIAWFLALAHELAERVYNSGFISTATGVQLDRLGRNNGILRDPAMPAIVILEITGNPGYIVEEGVQFKTQNDIVFEMIDVVKLDVHGFGTGQAVSQVYSDKANVPANSITVVAEPSEDIMTVNNPDAATGGSEAENDTTYRARIRLATKANPGPPVNGIITALTDVSGIRSVSVVENNGITKDANDNPPKSVHIYVFGGIDLEIGEAIFNSVAAGIQTSGKIAVQVKDLSDFEHTVYYDKATPLPLYANITVNVNAKFEDEGTEAIKQAVMNYINSLNMSEKVIHSFIYPDLYRIPGIVAAVVKIGKSAENTESTDIDISAEEVASIRWEDIEVTINVS